jgi:hypothetical protein
MVHYRKNKKRQVAKWGTPKKNILESVAMQIPTKVFLSVRPCSRVVALGDIILPPRDVDDED